MPDHAGKILHPKIVKQICKDADINPDELGWLRGNFPLQVKSTVSCKDRIFLLDETSFREKYILKVHYYFFKKINSNNVKFYNNKLFLINNNAHGG